MMVQPGDDEIQMIAHDCGSLTVAGLDVTDKIGSIVQLGTEDSMDDLHVECVARHRRSVCREIATSAVISSHWQPLGILGNGPVVHQATGKHRLGTKRQFAHPPDGAAGARSLGSGDVVME